MKNKYESTCKKSTHIHGNPEKSIMKHTPPLPTCSPPPLPPGLWEEIKNYISNATFRTQHSHPPSQNIRLYRRSITEIEQTWWLEGTSMLFGLFRIWGIQQVAACLVTYGPKVASYVVHMCPTLVHIKQDWTQHEIQMDTKSVKHGFLWIQCGAVDP